MCKQHKRSWFFHHSGYVCQHLAEANAPREPELSARCDWLRRTAAVLMRSCCVSARVSRFSPHFRPIVNTRCSEMAGWAIDLCPSAGCWLAVNAGNKECFRWLVQQSQCVQHQNQTAALRPASLRARDYQTHYSASPAGLCVRTQRWTEFSRTMNKSPAHRSPELLLCSHSSWEQCWENHVLHLCFSLVMQKEELHVLRIWSIHSASTKLTNQQPLTKAPSINDIFLLF